MPKNILLFEDKLGITEGYSSIWNSLLMKTQLSPTYNVHKRNSFRALGMTNVLLIRHGNRITPGFNTDITVQQNVKRWVIQQIQTVDPAIIICMDPVILFLFNPNWDQATLDNLRGGVYRILERPVVVSLPISAWHNVKKEKDIARMNEGFVDKEEYDEEHDDGDESDHEVNQVWVEPVVVPYGKFVLNADLMKVNRILKRMEVK